MSRTNTKVETKTITISVENLEATIASFLYATKTIPESWDITYMDLGLELNADGFVEFDIEVARPVKRKLQVVDETFKEPNKDEQLSFPLEVFEKIHVDA